QLWRYYPQMLELADDVGANWFLDLFEAVPTPEKAANVLEKTIARILKNHRVRRFDARHVLAELRKPALAVAPGTIEATTARIRGLNAKNSLNLLRRTTGRPHRGRKTSSVTRRSSIRRPRHAARRGLRHSATQRLSCVAASVWIGPGDTT